MRIVNYKLRCWLDSLRRFGARLHICPYQVNSAGSGTIVQLSSQKGDHLSIYKTSCGAYPYRISVYNGIYNRSANYGLELGELRHLNILLSRYLLKVKKVQMGAIPESKDLICRDCNRPALSVECVHTEVTTNDWLCEEYESL